MEPPRAMTTAIGVFESVLCHDLARTDPHFEQLDDGLARLVGVVVTSPVDGRGGRATGKGHPESLGSRGHRVGGEHASAAALRRACAVLDQRQLCIRELADRVSPHCLEDADYVERLPMIAPTGQDAPSVEENRGQVYPSSSHQHPGQRLVTTGEGGEGIEAFRMHHRLHRIRDDLPAHQGGPHALRYPSRCRPRRQW